MHSLFCLVKNGSSDKGNVSNGRRNVDVEHIFWWCWLEILSIWHQRLDNNLVTNIALVKDSPFRSFWKPFLECELNILLICHREPAYQNTEGYGNVCIKFKSYLGCVQLL